MCQVHAGRGADLFQVLRVHGARNGLHLCRMAQDPRDGNGGLRHAVFFSQFAQYLVQFREVRMIHETAAEHTELQRRPGLDRNVMQAAVVQHAVVPADGPVGGQVVQVQAAVNQLALVQGELQLVEHQGLLHILLQQFQLSGRHVAHAEVPHLAACRQLVEGFRHLFRIKQQVRAVEQQGIQVVGLQPAQARLGVFHDIVPAPVEFSRIPADTALALQVYVLPLQAGQRERVAEALFRLAVLAVAGGVVKEVDALFHRGADHVRRLLRIQ